MDNLKKKATLFYDELEQKLATCNQIAWAKLLLFFYKQRGQLRVVVILPLQAKILKRNLAPFF